MSSTKYANLPYIDTAPDIYESEDVFPAARTTADDSSDDEAVATRPAGRERPTDGEGKEELDTSNLLNSDEASKRFRKAERKAERIRTRFSFPHSRPQSPSPQRSTRPVPLSRRLKALQDEMAALEAELMDPANPLLQKEREEANMDTGELIRGLVNVRRRLERIRKEKEGRAKLVNEFIREERDVLPESTRLQPQTTAAEGPENAKPSVRTIVHIDQRVEDLEKIVGTSTVLDEVSPLPSPLLPLISRLNTQLTLLTQPRHIDSISRRLKLLQSDLERASSAPHNVHRRHTSQAANALSGSQVPPQKYEQMMPLLTRLGESLPLIPHILTRLRTLATLHTSASKFQNGLSDLEHEQEKMHSALVEIENALKTVEASLIENREIVGRNVTDLDARINKLIGRIEELGITGRDT